VSICLIPGARATIGKAAYLAPIITVFGHPGRRFGMMAEALVLALSGTVLGVAWSTLGIYIGSLVIHHSPPAAYAIRGVFLAIAMMVHGFLRSGTPRLFILVLLLIIVSVVSLTSTATAVTAGLATQILFPILIAAGVIILVNLCIFPEFSSSFLGQISIETLNDTAEALQGAGLYFTYTNHILNSESVGKPKTSHASDCTRATQGDTSGPKVSPKLNVSRSLTKSMKSAPETKARSTNAEVPKLITPRTKKLNRNAEISTEAKVISLSALTTAKGKLRAKLSSCRAAQRECNFEVAVSVLPPRSMKPISVSSMKKLVANTVALIGACESKYALLGGLESDNGKPESRSIAEENPINAASEQTSEKDENLETWSDNLRSENTELNLIKPRREIEFSDVQLLRYLLETVTNPYQDLQAVITRTVDVVSACIAYTYVRPLIST